MDILTEWNICEYKGKSVYYNVELFLKFVNSQHPKWRERLNEFTAALDKQVTIDSSNPNIQNVYEEIDIVVKRLANGLIANIPELYNDLEVIPTGSQTSKVKVGLPHETDYLFKVPNIDIDEFRTVDRLEANRLSDQFSHDIYRILGVNTIINDSRLQIHGIHRHRRISWVCVIMSAGDNADSKVGVSVDIILVKQYQPEKDKDKNNSIDTISNQAQQYMKDENLCVCLETDVYSLLDNNLMDTGVLENTILNKLDDTTKQGYRVAKYLLQLIHNNEYFGDTLKIVLLNCRIDDFLYGCKTNFKSYNLRCMFLHLITHIHKAPTLWAEQLNGGTLALCLLDLM